jgi:hypothetical protein
MMDFRNSFETRTVNGAVKAVCKICQRALAKNIGTMRMHHSMVHGRGMTRPLPISDTGYRGMHHAGVGSDRTHKSGPAYANGGAEEDKPAFYKMKLVGPNCAEFITEPMQLARELNPTLSGMIHSAEQMKKVLCDASQQPLEKRRYATSSVVALHDAHLRRLKGLMSDSDHAYNPMAHSFPEQPQMPVDEPTEPPSQVEEEEDESSLSSHAAMQRVMAVIPKKFHAKFARLGEYLKGHPNLIRFTPTGRPIVSGREIQRAHIMDIMRSLYTWPKSQALPTGLNEVIQALHLAGAPSHVLSNADALRMYHSVHEATQQSQTGVEGYESEAEEQQHEQEGEEEQQQRREEEELEVTRYATPLHAAMQQMQTIRKAEERAPTKQSPSMIPKPIYAPSKISGIPTMMTKREPSKASTSQSGKGKRRARKASLSETEEGDYLEEGVTEHWYDDPLFPGKPIRVLKLY